MDKYCIDWSKGGKNLSEDDYNRIFTETSKIISERKDETNEIALAFCFRGSVYQTWGKYQQAILDYSSAIELNNKIRAPFYNRAGAFFSLKMYKEALLDFKKAYEIDQNDKDALAWIEYITELINN